MRPTPEDLCVAIVMIGNGEALNAIDSAVFESLFKLGLAQRGPGGKPGQTLSGGRAFTRFEAGDDEAPAAIVDLEN